MGTQAVDFERSESGQVMDLLSTLRPCQREALPAGGPWNWSEPGSADAFAQAVGVRSRRRAVLEAGSSPLGKGADGNLVER